MFYDMFLIEKILLGGNFHCHPNMQLPSSQIIKEPDVSANIFTAH